jgi:hypothetical protein
MSRTNINVSFPEADNDLYKELVLESSVTYVPTAALARKYIRLGRQAQQTKSYIK